MLVFLEGTHEQWLQQVRGVLGPAGAEGAGMWVRWYAIEYLEMGFKRRFERERRAVFSLHWRLTGAQASHLWAPESRGLFEVITFDEASHRG